MSITLDTMLARVGFKAPRRGSVDPGETPASNLGRGRPLTEADLDALYRPLPSFTDLLPWVEYLPDARCFLLDDGRSVGALLELTPVACEGRPEAFLEQLQDQLQGVLAESLPEEAESPWVLQYFVQDEPSLTSTALELRAYAAGRGVTDNPYTRAYLELMEQHLALIGRPVFIDEAVTGAPWRGKRRRVRMTLHRRLSRVQANPRMLGGLTPEEHLNEALDKLATALTGAGIGVRRGGPAELFAWLVPWFNPRPSCAQGDSQRLLAMAPWPEDSEEAPFGADFAEALIYCMPYSDLPSNTWWFDGLPQRGGLPHTAISVQGFRLLPKAGHYTAERVRGDHRYALLDRLPAGSILAQTLIILPQDAVLNHIGGIRAAAGGPKAESQIARREVDAAEHAIAEGDKLYPLTQTIYLRGEDLEDLRRKANGVRALLIGSGIQPIAQESDLTALDTYIRCLPMNFDARRERLNRPSRRSRLVFTSQIAALFPAYGRAGGTGHPGLVFYNRGGDPLLFDPLHQADRKKSAHMVILGPTGSGKSATVIYLLMQMVALYRPRLFIVDGKNSFRLLAQYFQQHGLGVNFVRITANTDVSLPPFADAFKALEAEASLASRIEAALETPGEDDDAALLAEDEDQEGDGARDYLGEMELAARIMITGGDERQEARLMPADRLLIRLAILGAAKTVKAAGRAQVLTQDVVAALRAIAADAAQSERRQARAEDMADAMQLFCSGLGGRLFNRPGTAWPEADVTIFEMGLLARDGYHSELALAYVGLINHVTALVERHQQDTRQTLMLTDEGHVVTTNPLLSPYAVKITKLWRSFGAWFWLATQNLEDFPDAARRMLNMMEWWLCLVMPKDEVEQIARFRALTEEERHLLLSAHKEPGKYIEGAVLSDRFNALFRSVPPAPALALAMTEKHEKAERAQIMDEMNCSELQAAYEVARRLERTRGELADAQMNTGGAR